MADGSGQRNSRRRAFGLLRVGRDADGRRAVALRVHQVDRRLVARHQAAVGVGRRRAEGQQRRRVLQQAADVVAGHLGEQRVAVGVVEERLIVVPEALVGVHAGAVVAEERLGHERGGVAVLVGDVLDDVLVHHQPVGHLGQGVEPHVDLGLAGGAHLVVVDLDVDAGLDQRQHDLRAEVLQLVGRRHGEVAFLVARPVAEVGLAVRRRRCSRCPPRSRCSSSRCWLVWSKRMSLKMKNSASGPK